ncbi:MAG: enoyl-CoA hydratase/isomerase family protein [Phycisphaerales bacterium]
MSLVVVDFAAPVATITLNDPDRRNALSGDMFTCLEAAIDGVAHHENSVALRLRGAGSAFCAGFDLGACVERPGTLALFIRRLSIVNRKLRRLRQVVVAEVQGAALAGGCAMLSACDFVCVASDAQLGYPVHRIGVSPAVSLPTLMQAVGGAARALTLSGDLVDGRRALAIGLATHCSDDAESLPALVERLCSRLATKGPKALAATKAWLNELDGSNLNDPFQRTMEGSADLCDGDECVRMLRAFWESRKRSA